jgi:hypothetical protein
MYTAVLVNPDTLEIGEVMTVKLEANGLPNDSQIDSIVWDFDKVDNTLYSTDTSFFDTIAELEISDAGSLSSLIKQGYLVIPKEKIAVSKNYWHCYIKLICYSPGVFTFPAPKIYFSNSISQTPAKSYSFFVKIPDGIKGTKPEEIAAEKDIIEVEHSLWYYLKYLLVALFIGSLLWFVYKKYNTKVSPILAPEPLEINTIISPSQKALLALDFLDKKNLWQQGLIKQYQTELTDIIRTYLSERFNINALEMTSSELLSHPQIFHLNENTKEKLKHLLTISDIVKFAKGRADDSMYPSFMIDAIDIVLITKSQL